ncbi:MAG: hypothetical protein QXX14_05165, partial [Candidatus Methanomethyliaceae archaeon]
IDDYERGFLICWEIMLATLSSLKQEYPDYPLKDEQQQQQPSQSKTEEEVYEVAPRKKAKNKDKSKSKNTKG